MAKRSRIQLPLFTGQSMTAEELRAHQAKQASEADIQADIVKALVKLGWLVVRVNGGGGYDKRGNWRWNYWVDGTLHAGFPDLVAFKGSAAVLLEVKKQKGKLAPPQEVFHERAAHRGVTVHVVRSVEEVQEIIGGL
jgi:hypothetical protein